MKAGGEPFKALTVAGSDSGGAAGLQADLKTFTVLGVYGMSVVTAVTAQNSLTVTGNKAMTPEFVELQLNTVLSDYGADAIKTGFIGQADIIESMARTLTAHQPVHLIVDPVLVNHKGESMFSQSVTQAYIEYLLPLSEVVTPNLGEASLISGLAVQSLTDMEKAAQKIQALGPRWVLVKGGRVEESTVDVLFGDSKISHLSSHWIDTGNTHGSGDTLSAAICAFLAMGLEMETAVKRAQRFTYDAIQGAVGWRLGGGHGPVSYW